MSGLVLPPSQKCNADRVTRRCLCFAVAQDSCRVAQGISMKSRLIVTLLLAGLVSPANAASVAKTYSYFSIGGATLEEIQNELDVRGPKVKTTGRRHPGATQMEFTSRIGYANSAEGCRIAKATVTVKAKIILPRWRRPGRADGDVRLVWDTLASDIKRHEESHVVIAKNYARELEQVLLKVGRQKDCKAAQAKAADLTQRVLARHDRAQVQFDVVEGRNFESRILRLLRYRLERIAKGQLPG
jgi:predicted secreted Zn-dependent protease